MPPSACSKRPTRCLSAPVKAPFSCPKSSDSSRFSCSAAQLTLTKLRPARSELWCDRARDELLAGARFAADEHRRVALGHFLDNRQHRLQRAARADDAVEVVDVLLRVPEVFDLVLQPPVLDGLFDLELHLLDFERLLHVVEGADLHRLDRRVHRPEGGHQNHRRRRMERLGGAQHVETVAASHLQVAQHDVVLPFVQLLDRHVAVRRLVHFVMRVRQRADNPAPQRIVIICHQNPAHCSALSFIRGASPRGPPTPSLARPLDPRSAPAARCAPLVHVLDAETPPEP